MQNIYHTDILSDMKTCCICLKNKDESEFQTSTRSADGLLASCKECYNARARDYTSKRSPDANESRKDCRRRARERDREFIRDYLSTHPCVDCGETRWEVLDFDHVRGKKFRNISEMVRRCTTIENIQKEIDKCDV